MCGIFGLFVRRDSAFTPRIIRKSLSILARFSESRGKDSSGLALRNEVRRELIVVKAAEPLSDLLERQMRRCWHLPQFAQSPLINRGKLFKQTEPLL